MATSRDRWIGLAVLALPCAVVTMDLTVPSGRWPR
jgi:hypothetical protein